MMASRSVKNAAQVSSPWPGRTAHQLGLGAQRDTESVLTPQRHDRDGRNDELPRDGLVNLFDMIAHAQLRALVLTTNGKRTHPRNPVVKVLALLQAEHRLRLVVLSSIVAAVAARVPDKKGRVTDPARNKGCEF